MINRQKGTYDIYGKEGKVLKQISYVVDAYASLYNYDYIRTPLFEATELYHRSVGENTDIVSKETYDFKDRGERNITLRPEGTAGITRALIENKLYGNRNDTIKLYYDGTMYRYERPQSGRNREFTQVGVEVFNSDDVMIDAEVISLGFNILRELGINDVEVHINTLGDKESRSNYTESLVEYFKPHINNLCPDCQKRINTNPLRILDCKVDREMDIFKNAPKINDYLSKDSMERFKKLESMLKILDVDYVIDNNLVRGLDYYDHVVFEYITNYSNVTLGGGGRYNHLVEQLGGPELPAVGFAFGVERLINEIINNQEIEEQKLDVYIMSINEEEKMHALEISQNLRLNDIKTEINGNNLSMKSQFKIADNAKFLIILNSEELNKGLVKVRDNATKEEVSVDESEIAEYMLGII